MQNLVQRLNGRAEPFAEIYGAAEKSSFKSRAVGIFSHKSLKGFISRL
jgi:hypothetical protein